MNRTTRTCSQGLLGWTLVLALTACAAMLPSKSEGASEPSFGPDGSIPRRIALRSERDLIHVAVEHVLVAELEASGFTCTQQDDDPDAILAVEVRTSDFAPVHLELTLTDARTGRGLWKARVSREWDMYASIVSASESNAMLRADLPAGSR